MRGKRGRLKRKEEDRRVCEFECDSVRAWRARARLIPTCGSPRTASRRANGAVIARDL
jgi:hypothetical protein